MFAWFEGLVQPTRTDPSAPPPAGGAGDSGLLRFCWHYARQMRGLIAALFAAGLAVALCDAAIPLIIGRAVTLATTYAPAALWRDAWPQLLGMAAVLLVARPAALLVQNLVTNQAIAGNFTNLVRWQAHWHVVRQSLTFFQNDFAGRIANRVMQTGPSLRESITASTNAAWYIVVYGTSAILLLAHAEPLLALPILAWFVGYGLFLRVFVPRLRERSRLVSEVRSALTGRVVDSYTNILTVKLFARARDEDGFVREGVDEHTAAMHRLYRVQTRFTLTLAAMNAIMLVGTGAMALSLWARGAIAVGTVATALPMAWQISNMAGWVAFNISQIFDNVGVVQDGMKSIAVPQGMPDPPDAAELRVTAGGIRFEGVSFGYGTTRGVLHGLSLDVAPGERIGLIGRSGAGKSTLVSLLLRFHAPDAGRILVDGQDIAGVSAESLRGAVAVVTQDTSLLHRSIRDNIRYGRPGATEAEVTEAARQAEALDFIAGLEDWQGRTGMDAQVGERGVKLSGGQRQRVAIARVVLKAAPILVLDEATSALDSEVEAAIQDQLDHLMQGRTVIAIAHRLSTIARMDRLVVLDEGRIVEQGTHAALLAAGGAYARLWARQSGGFVQVAA